MNVYVFNSLWNVWWEQIVSMHVFVCKCLYDGKGDAGKYVPKKTKFMKNSNKYYQFHQAIEHQFEFG